MSEMNFVDTMKKETFDEHELSKDSGFATSLMSGEWDALAFIEWQNALYPVYVALEMFHQCLLERDSPICWCFAMFRTMRSRRGALQRSM